MNERIGDDMDRRDFMKKTSAAVVSGALSLPLLAASGCMESTQRTSGKKPNIIYIFTDQQSASMMSCAGNKWLKTPAMDYIAENGIRFTRAYTTNPVYVPARVAMMTGRFPGSFNDKNGKPARENSGGLRIGQISRKFMGKGSYRHVELISLLKD